MTEEQCKAAYEQLAATLSANRLTWVVNDVEANLRIGKMSEEPILVQRPRTTARDRVLTGFILEQELPVLKATSQKGIKQTEYSQQERLQMLLRAVRLSLLSVCDVAEQIFSALVKFRLSDSISFLPDGTPETAFEMNPSVLAGTAEARNRLSGVVEALEAEIHAE